MAQAQTDFVKTAIDETKRQYAPDSRTAIFAVEGELLNDSLCVLKGRCNNRLAVEALLHRLDSAGIACVDGIKMLPDKNLGSLTRGLVTVCCASLRGGPRHAAEMMTQAIMGTPLLVLERDKAWLLVQTPDHYISWVPANSVTLQDEAGWKAWRESARYVYTGYQALCMMRPTATRHRVGHRGRCHSASRRESPQGVRSRSLPRRPQRFLKSDEYSEIARDLAQWAARPLDMKVVVRTARQMMGSTYLWGGTSVKGADCSGFVKTAYFCSGVILSRDASQQALTGDIIPADQWQSCQTGDLLFFGDERGRVDHVALYLNDGEYIHCSGQVKLNNLDPAAPDYRESNFVSISRMKTKIGTPGITAVKAHPWYFDQK